MFIIEMNGVSAEGYGGTIDYKTYKYCIDNDIDLEEYEEGEVIIPEEFDFDNDGFYNYTNLWSYGSFGLFSSGSITVYNSEYQRLFESNLDIESLKKAGVNVIMASSTMDILNKLKENSAAVYGNRYSQNDDTESHDIETSDTEFDPSKFTIYYHHDHQGEDFIISMEYDGQEVYMELEGEFTHSEHEIFGKEPTNSDISAEEDELDALDTNLESVEITEPAMVIRISQAYRENMTPQELYDVTRSAWKVNLDRANTIDYAFAVYKGEIKEVYKVAGWHEAGTTFVPVREDILGSGRFEFVGTVAEDAIRDKYLNKSVKHMFKKGAVIPTMYVNC